MDDQLDKHPEEANSEAMSEGPGLETAVAGADTGTPDAVKAAGGEPVGDAGGEPEDAIDASSIAEPSMRFPGAQMPQIDEPPIAAPAAQAHPAEFPQFGPGTGAKVPRNINLLMDVKLPVSIELGRTTLPIAEILEWGQGSIIELDRLAGEPVDLMVNNKLVAKGEVVVVDEKFGLRVTSLMSPRERLQSL